MFERRRLLRGLGAALVLAPFATGGVACVQQQVLRPALRHRFGEEGELGPLDGLQVFISERVLLRRNLRSGDRRVSGGRIVSRSGRKVEEIVIWGRTPGVIVDSGAGWLDVSFSEGSALRFVETLGGEDDAELRPVQGAAPGGDADLALAHEAALRGEKDGVYRLAHRREQGKPPRVEFQGHSWSAEGRSSEAVLMVRHRARGSFRWKRRRLRGRRVK